MPSTVYRVLVTGSRHWGDRGAVRGALDRVWYDLGFHEPIVVVHGHCPTGADHWADEWAADNADLGVVVERHPADWDRYGKPAGPRRNGEMVDLGANLCLAFLMPDSRGTRDCMFKAAGAGIPIRQFHSTGVSTAGGAS